MKTHRLGMCAALVAGMASAALGSPRESFTFTNVLSNPAPAAGGAATTVNHAFAGGYVTRYIIVTGTMAEVTASTFAYESVIQVIAPGGVIATIQPSQVVGYTGTTNVTNLVYKLPIEVANSTGNWGFRFMESYNDGGAADDANWTTVTFTLDDGPPSATDLGFLAQQGRTKSFNKALFAGDVQWYKFIVPSTIDAVANTFLDIDTAGTTLTDAGDGPNDTEIGLYTADGVLISNDDDDGAGRDSMLSFGLGGRPAEGGATYNGQDGVLAPGVYYLSVSGFNTTFRAASWDASTTGTQTGTVNVRMRTNVGAPNAKHLGTLSQDGVTAASIPIASGGIQWFKFDVATDVTAGAGTFVDVHTQGSILPGSLSNNDTEIGIYDANGNRVNFDDDGAGVGNLSLLSFGAGGRPGISGGGTARNGQDGALMAGTYFIAISAYNSAFGVDQWGATTTHVRTGLAQLNFVTNTGDAATCPADLDNGTNSGTPDGGVTIDDLLYFLLRFEEGC